MSAPSKLLLPTLRMLLLAGCALVGSSCARDDGAATEPDAGLNVYAAASLTDVIAEIAANFERKYATPVSLNLASSNALAQQIVHAPRADVYISANEAWMDFVEDRGYLVPGTRIVPARNALVLIRNNQGRAQVSDIRDLPEADFEYLVLGNPEGVPAGVYARQWLESVPLADGRSVWEAVKDRVSPAPDVRAAIAQVKGTQGTVGIVYATDYRAFQGEVTLLLEAGPEAGSPARGSPPPITFHAALINRTREAAVGQAFLSYLMSAQAQAVFARHGFRPAGG